MAGGSSSDAPSKPEEGAAAPASGSGSGGEGGIVDTVSSSLQNLRIGERVRGAIRAYKEVEEEGTPLRPYIRAARESINDAAGAVKGKWVSAKEGACATVESLKPDLSWISKEVGTVDEFARTHKELVVGGVGLAVAVPSLLGGPKRALVNGALAAGVTAGVFGFSEWWDRRHHATEAPKKD